MKVRFLAVAELEQVEAATHYESERTGLGSEFVDELDRTVKLILEYPNAWTASSKHTRACQMKRFPYSVIYREYSQEIVVVALQHNSRDPRRWEERGFE